MSFKDISVDVGGLFYSFEDGENRIRIVSENPVPFWTAFKQGVNGEKGTSKNFLTLEAMDKYNMDVTDEREEAKQRFGMWVIDRKDGKVRFANVSPGIVGKIKNLANSTEYGFDGLIPYDITVKRTGKGLETRYDVMAARANTELTEDEKTEIAKKGSAYAFLYKEAEDRASAPAPKEEEMSTDTEVNASQVKVRIASLLKKLGESPTTAEEYAAAMKKWVEEEPLADGSNLISIKEKLEIAYQMRSTKQEIRVENIPF